MKCLRQDWKNEFKLHLKEFFEREVEKSNYFMWLPATRKTIFSIKVTFILVRGELRTLLDWKRLKSILCYSPFHKTLSKSSFNTFDLGKVLWNGRYFGRECMPNVKGKKLWLQPLPISKSLCTYHIYLFGMIETVSFTLKEFA